VRALLASCGLALVLAAAPGRAGAASVKVDHEVDGGIPVTAYRDGRPGLHPAIFILYGAHGLNAAGAMYDAYARALVRAGDNAYVVDYHARSKLAATSGNRTTIFAANLGAWVQAVEQVISAVSDEPGVDASRLGLLGFSQGAFLAVAVAADDADVGAVVEFYGGIPPSLVGHLDRLPPTLILHGDADRVVPVSEAHRLADALSSTGSRYDIMIYPGAGHGFSAQLDSAAGRDALRRAVQYFGDNL
jgi:carboxymethylenebutenolidase